MTDLKSNIQDYIGILVKQREEQANQASILSVEILVLKRTITGLEQEIQSLARQLNEAKFLKLEQSFEAGHDDSHAAHTAADRQPSSG
jgi:hypothetical protein